MELAPFGAQRLILYIHIYTAHIFLSDNIFYIIYSLALLGDDPFTQYVNVCAIDSIVCK